MKVDANTLFKVVRQVVQEEVRKVLPEMIKTHLTESYMKRLVQESASQPKKKKSPGLAEVLMTPKEDEETEDIPEPLENNDKGIYGQGYPGMHKDENVSKLLSKSNPLAFVYEGVKIPGDEDAAPPSIPIEKGGLNFDVMNKLVEGMEKRSATKGEMMTPEMKMRQLEEKRRALEIKTR